VLLATAAMGTRFEILLPLPDGADAAAEARLRAAGEAALEEIEIWHRQLTRFEPDSLVSHIVRQAARAPVRLDSETFALFADAAAVAAASAGAFDITRPCAPDGRSAAEAIVLDAASSTIAFRRAGVRLDLGGIGKGHALDLAAARLRGAGVRSALLHGGTSSVVGLGRPPGGAGWPVRLGAGSDAPVISLCDKALSVSDAASQGGHIVAPHGHAHGKDTGSLFRGTAKKTPGVFSATSASAAVAVTGPSARLADAWSTALVALGHRPPGFPDDSDLYWLRRPAA
jgi:thiamine biosynthesis lipoprotein